MTSRGEVYMNHAAVGGVDADLKMGYYFWILDCGEFLVAVDCGFSPEEAVRRGRPFETEPGQLLSDAGVKPEDVDFLILTHLHYDHAGNIDLFPRATIVVAQNELDFWFEDISSRPQFSFLIEPRSLRLLSEANEAGRVKSFSESMDIVGLTVERLGGHSPGQTVVHVPTDNGTVILASDAAHFAEQVTLDALFGFVADVPESYRALDRLKELGGAEEVIAVVHGHDSAPPSNFRDVPGTKDGALKVLGEWPRRNHKLPANQTSSQIG